eukprot:GHVU01008083.1.p1 GENE.GHVU01008083.1~~GHVU01008083.1.p1  ORF type:complete len:206 (-),score=13.01 GHVU01008083.1:345-962(-)
MTSSSHVAVTQGDVFLKIFLNGILDTTMTLSGTPMKNSGGLLVGARRGFIGFEGYIDDLKYYSDVVSVGGRGVISRVQWLLIHFQQQQIASMANPALTGIVESDHLALGCLSCSYSEAISPSLCAAPMQLCSLEELYGGGFHTARLVLRQASLEQPANGAPRRVQGWLQQADDIWFSDIEPQVWYWTFFGVVIYQETILVCAGDQ